MPYSDDLAPVFPSDKIKCKDCIFRKLGIVGYKNKYCDIYERGKPENVLWKNADCEYYQKEQVSG